MNNTTSLRLLLYLSLVLIMISACTSPAVNTAEPNETKVAVTSVSTVEPTLTPVQTEESSQVEETVTLDPNTSPISWRDLPVVPDVSPAMIEVYQRGLTAGRVSNRFSKIGDCQNVDSFFLSMFDKGSYTLGDEFAYLQPTIDFFAGSWGRKSMAVHGGLNVAAVQTAMWTAVVEEYTKKQGTCLKGETPLVCELRDYNPSFALISMEESWEGSSVDDYETHLREVVDYVLSQDIVPILATRTETLTQDKQINEIVVKVAAEYELPLWNFGASVAHLPNAGIIEDDGFHLTQGGADFTDTYTMTRGWPWRNLTALQTLDAVSKGVGAQ